MLSQLNVIHTFTAYLHKTYFISIVQSTFRRTKLSIYDIHLVLIFTQFLPKGNNYESPR